MSRWIDGKWLLNFFVGFPDDYTLTIGNLRAVINDAPTIEVSEDCISREWLEQNFQTVCENVRCNECSFNSDDCGLIKFIIDAPSVVPSRAEGEWVRNFDGNEWYWYCTNCKTQWYEDDLWMGGNEFPNFCPNCGAKMKGAE